MEIEKEENIIVRYIPQYIVIETRYKPLETYVDPQPVSQTVRNSVKYESEARIESETSLQDVQSDQYYAIDDDDNECAELKQENFEDDTNDGGVHSKLSPTKRNCNSKSRRLLNEWFMSNLQNPYPTEEQKEVLMSQTNMTKVQVNYWFINKRKRNKHLLNNTKKATGDIDLLDDVENALLSDAVPDTAGTTVELEVTIQSDSVRKRRRKKAIAEQGQLPEICDVCGKSFGQRYMLQSHLKRHDPSTWEVCHICKKSFPDGLKRHMRVHSGERPYVCHICGASYKQAYGLTMHKAIHNESGELFYCDTCNKGYRSKYTLKDHLKLHYRVRNDDSALVVMKSTWKPAKVCTICGFETYNIRSHMIARHSTLRPFKCEICPETFKFKKDLQTHYAYHSDEMNFHCDECEKRFKTKRKLVIHKRIHTNEKSYVCEVCDRSFLVSTYLRKHMRGHTGQRKRHACTECSKDYSGITDLRRHLEKEHGIKVQPNPKYSNNNMTKKYKVT
ncbi:zinc finger protein 175-like isoform X1 [Bradysia coprophila]|uniref:zinc finger protein 175-like isoform X1 n=1 Tax=Bradysia coprophila TaxID=38358 RepID=UPI00187DAA81|nr:zinc finger protein 175-like isoform X1 [Bradysia coprophila]